MGEMPAGYDAWKLQSPYDEWGEPEEDPPCWGCLGEGWMVGPEDVVIPCTECSAEPELVDLLYLDGEGALCGSPAQ